MTSRDRGCLPFSPPVHAFIFIMHRVQHSHFSALYAGRFASNIANSRSRAFGLSICKSPLRDSNLQPRPQQFTVGPPGSRCYSFLYLTSCFASCDCDRPTRRGVILSDLNPHQNLQGFELWWSTPRPPSPPPPPPWKPRMALALMVRGWG